MKNVLNFFEIFSVSLNGNFGVNSLFQQTCAEAAKVDYGGRFL
jgi:hypothetical protein